MNNTTYGANWTGTITGTSSTNAGAGTSISSCRRRRRGHDCRCQQSGGTAPRSAAHPRPLWLPHEATTSWTYGLAASNLTSGHTYSVVGQATDSAGNIGTSSSVSFTYSTDGSGTLTTPTTNVSASSTGNTITFTYTAAAAGTTNGAVTLVVPSGWSAPSTTGSAAGYDHCLGGHRYSR